MFCPEDHLHREETLENGAKRRPKGTGLWALLGADGKREGIAPDASWDQPSSQCATLPWASLNSGSGHRGCTAATHCPDAHLSRLSCQHVQEGAGLPVSSDALTEQQGWRERHCRCQMPWEAGVRCSP